MADLFADDGTLRGVRCSSCGTTFFPPQHYGCEVCGSESLEDAAVAPAGTLRSFAVVNLHPTRPTPYTIGEIELDAGPVIHALLAGDAAVGARVRGAVSDDVMSFERTP